MKYLFTANNEYPTAVIHISFTLCAAVTRSGCCIPDNISRPLIVDDFWLGYSHAVGGRQCTTFVTVTLTPRRDS